MVARNGPKQPPSWSVVVTATDQDTPLVTSFTAPLVLTEVLTAIPQQRFAVRDSEGNHGSTCGVVHKLDALHASRLLEGSRYRPPTPPGKPMRPRISNMAWGQRAGPHAEPSIWPAQSQPGVPISPLKIGPSTLADNVGSAGLAGRLPARRGARAVHPARVHRMPGETARLGQHKLR